MHLCCVTCVSVWSAAGVVGWLSEYWLVPASEPAVLRQNAAPNLAKSNLWLNQLPSEQEENLCLWFHWDSDWDLLVLKWNILAKTWDSLRSHLLNQSDCVCSCKLVLMLRAQWGEKSLPVVSRWLRGNRVDYNAPLIPYGNWKVLSCILEVFPALYKN